MHRDGLVDISAELDSLGLYLEYDEPAGFIVCVVVEGSAAAQCGRVKPGDVATEYNSVSIQPLQLVPAVRKHGVRPGKFAFLRVRKEDGSFVECAIERSDSAPAPPLSQTQSTVKQSIESKTSAHAASLLKAHNSIPHVLPNGSGTGPRANGVSGRSLGNFYASPTADERPAPNVHRASPVSPSASDIHRSLTFDRSSRPSYAVERIPGHGGASSSTTSSSSCKGLGALRWKNLSNNGPALSNSKNILFCGGSAPNSAKRRGTSDTENQSRIKSCEENANLSEALARIEELSQENDSLRAKLERHEQGHMLHAQQEEMEKKMQKFVKLTKEKESSYERQIANLKEEVINSHRTVQELMGEKAEHQWMTEKDKVEPSIAISKCLEAVVLKIFAVKPRFSDLICRDTYTMMFTWCFESWLSPTLARNIAGGTRLLARDEALKDGLLDCGAMEAMVKLTGMFSKENSAVESAAVEHACASLSNFALKHPRSRSCVVLCGGMPALVSLMEGSASPSLLEKACAAISHILCSVETKSAFCTSGGIQALVKVMSTKCSLFGNERLFEEAARAFRNLAHGDDAICRQICAAGGTDALAHVCESVRDTAVITQAAAAMANLACDEACRADMKKKFNWTKDFAAKKIAALAVETRPAHSHSPAPIRPKSAGFSASSTPIHSPLSTRGVINRTKSATSNVRKNNVTAARRLSDRPRSVSGSYGPDSDAESDSGYPIKTTDRSPAHNKGLSRSVSSENLTQSTRNTRNGATESQHANHRNGARESQHAPLTSMSRGAPVNGSGASRRLY